jgi:hypothetical protein
MSTRQHSMWQQWCRVVGCRCRMSSMTSSATFETQYYSRLKAFQRNNRSYYVQTVQANDIVTMCYEVTRRYTALPPT